MLRRLLRRDHKQDAALPLQAFAERGVVGRTAGVLLGDLLEVGEAALVVLPDLGRAVDQEGAESGWFVEDELDAGVAAEVLVFLAALGGGDVEAVAVPVEPVRRDLGAAVLADGSDDDVLGLGEELFDFWSRFMAAGAVVTEWLLGGVAVFYLTPRPPSLARKGESSSTEGASISITDGRVRRGEGDR